MFCQGVNVILSPVMIFIEYQCALCEIYVGQKLPQLLFNSHLARWLGALTIVILISALPRLHVLYCKRFCHSNAGAKMNSRDKDVNILLQPTTSLLFDYIKSSECSYFKSSCIKFCRIMIKSLFVGYATHK